MQPTFNSGSPVNANPLPPRVDIVILNWNGRDDTLACLESVARIDYPNYRVIVADNGSGDGSVDAIRLAYPDVHVIENRANLGFAAGNNSAIAHALESGAEFVLLLNNDTVVDLAVLSAFVDASKRMPHGGVFGAKIYYYGDKQKLWYAGGYWNAQTLSFNEHGAGELDHGQFDTLTETEWVIGCAMFVRAEVFRKVGLLEPSYFLNNEEIDFCSRAKRAGFACVYVPAARLWHKISVSFGGEDSPLKEYFSARNRLLWARRNAESGLRLRIYLDSTASLMRRFMRPLLGQTMSAPPSLKSWWWSVRSAFRDPRHRAALLGFRDFWLGRFGNCPDTIRTLAREWSSKRTDRAGAQSAPQQS